MKREAYLKAAFTKVLKRRAPHFEVLQFSTAGAPDREIVGNGITTRWEFKHATPDYSSQGLQTLTACRLALQGHCRFVVLYEDKRGENKRTLIVTPIAMHLNVGNGAALKTETFCDGHDPEWLVDQVMWLHKVIQYQQHEPRRHETNQGTTRS